MITKIAETHFNALRAAGGSMPSDLPQSRAPASAAAHDALDMFLSTPSFSSKQIAIESLLRQMTLGSSSPR